MPNYTPNLNLVKPLVTEQYDIGKVTNENADILDLEIQAVKDDVLDKQDTLVSGTNIKTINGNSVLGSGDLPITSGALKNWIINGMFDVWQRGISQTSSGYGSDDRFANGNSGSTKIHSRQEFAIGQTDVPNNPKYFSRTIVSSVVGADNWVYKQQFIEDVTKLSGKTITLSFWAKADANKNIAIEFRQYFGTGGSAIVNEIGVQKFALTTSWQKITKTVTLPSVSGKTIGDGSAIIAQFWFDAGTNSNSRTNNLGNQSGTFDIANVSLVEGSVAVECQNQPYADVLRECQRYYERGFVGASGLSVGTTEGYLFVRFKTDKRVLPTISVIAGSSLASCISEIAVAERTPTSLIFERDINHVRIVTVGATYSANGRLIVFRFDIIQADAEL